MFTLFKKVQINKVIDVFLKKHLYTHKHHNSFNEDKNSDNKQ